MEIGTKVRDLDGREKGIGVIREVCTPERCVFVDFPEKKWVHRWLKGLEEVQVDEYGLDDVGLAYAGLESRVRMLQVEVAGVVRMVGGIQEEYKDLESLTAKLKEALGHHLEPFTQGQRVMAPNGGAFFVDAVDRAFGEWVVLGHFPDKPTKRYTYPAKELKA